MRIKFRNPIWLTFFVACLVGAVFSWYYFPRAFPIVNIDISMDRTKALSKAKKYADQHELGPNSYKQAAAFKHDQDVQAFVELEAGGKDKYKRMIRDGLYFPYRWHVRHFQQNKTRETIIRFTPNGQIYGFHEKWPEDDTGPALKAAKARKIAEANATDDWSVNLKKYKFLSHSQTERPNGRIDHSYTYERKNASLGDGHYRLRLSVSGNQLSEVTHYVKIPEGFTRRFKNMRSANRFIQTLGSASMYLLYFLIGCLFGSYWLLTRDALKWKTALGWGILITILLFLVKVNQLPIAWMNYDTALSPTNFVLKLVVDALSSTLLMGTLITISFISAEGLTRMAFDHHPKFWRLWNPRAAGTKTVRNLTIFGYVFVGLYFAYNVFVYMYAQDALNWWVPSSVLFDPDILAHYAPWLKPVVNSLRAGFWEECLFRAVPIAGAALLGNYVGRRRLFIGVTLVLQALVFGAGHAAYATQPSYARVVELFSSSIGLGLIYLAYGLLPVIITHYLYDLILMAMPLFAATGASAVLNQGVILLFLSIPLLVIIYGRFQNGAWKDLPESLLNRSWNPSSSTTSRTSGFPISAGLSMISVGVTVIGGIIGIGMWWQFTSFQTHEVPLRMTRAEALTRARTAVESHNNLNFDKWMLTASVNGRPSMAHEFVWQKGGSDAYEKLMGSYLMGPVWDVRLMTFEGSIEQRAEEYSVHLAPGADLTRIEHDLPESAGGDSLPKSAARSIADSVVGTNYTVSLNQTELVSADPQPRPNRRDWTFTYAVPEDYPLDQGEARIAVEISGSEVTDSQRFVHLPQEWERENRSRQKRLQLFQQIGSTVLYLLIFAGAFAGIVVWARGIGFGTQAFLWVTAGIVGLSALDVFNSWPVMMSSLKTAEPYMTQIVMKVIRKLIFPLVAGGFFGLIAGYAHGRIGAVERQSLRRSVLTGFGVGSITTGLMALAGYFSPDLLPTWGNYAGLDTTVPWLQQTITSTQYYLRGTVIVLLLSVGYHRLSRAGTKYKTLSIIGFGLFGAIVASTGSFIHSTELFLSCLVLTLVFSICGWFLIPRDRSFIPIAVAVTVLVPQVKHVLTANNIHVTLGASIAYSVILMVSIFWTVALHRTQNEH